MDSLNDSLTEYRKVTTNTKSLQSYDKYLERLNTFELHKWFAKPLEFCPIECARRGWINLSKDTLKCVICSNILYHHSQSSLSISKFVKFSNQKLNENKFSTDQKFLVEKHNLKCPWRNLKVPDQYIQVDVYNEDKVYKEFNSLRETFKNCVQLPCLDESILQIFDKKNIFYDSSKKFQNHENYYIIYILSCCGWSYNEQKDVIKCERCSRTVGLWLYKQIINREDEEPKGMDDNSSENKEFLSLFGQTEFDTDDSIIKNLLTKMVNSIVIEDESEMTRNSIKKLDRTKRKLDDSLNGDRNMKGKKTLNPMVEHHSWCPWLLESGSQLKLKVPNDKVKIINKNMCILNFEMLKKYFMKQQDGGLCNNVEKENNGVRLKGSDILNSDSLLDRIKSVQSILVNCTSQLSQN